MTTQEQLSDHITGYLVSGGLFNPELMEHDKVRNLLIDCREFLDTLKPNPAYATATHEMDKRGVLTTRPSISHEA